MRGVKGLAVGASEQHPGLHDPVKLWRRDRTAAVRVAHQPTLVIIDDDKVVGALGFRCLLHS